MLKRQWRAVLDLVLRPRIGEDERVAQVGVTGSQLPCHSSHGCEG